MNSEMKVILNFQLVQNISMRLTLIFLVDCKLTYLFGAHIRKFENTMLPSYSPSVYSYQQIKMGHSHHIGGSCCWKY
jgi:hypothetical protein